MVAFRSTDTSGRASGLLLRCVLYCLLALGLIIVDKRYDHLGRIRRFLSVVAYPVQVAVASPFEGWNWFRESVTTRDVLRSDNARLQAQLRLAEFKLQRYEALEAESQRLRALRDNTAGVADRFIIGNIMDVDLDHNQPSNFLYADILEYLIRNRKSRIDFVQEGYATIGTLRKKMGAAGYDEEDVFSAIKHLWNGA